MNHKIAELKQHLLEMLKSILLEESVRFFNLHPEITSFGWHQFINEWSVDRYIQFEDSLERPDVSGNLGEFIYANSSLYPVQQRVAKFLKQFDRDLLIAAFGDGVDVHVYPDKTIEIIPDHDWRDCYLEL